MKRSLLFFMITAIACSCRDDSIDSVRPVAKFELFRLDGSDLDGSDLNIAVYDIYGLINHSTGASSYLWDFGDGTSSNYKEPSLIYAKPGIYAVTLTAMNASGIKSTSSRQLRVHQHVIRNVTIKNLNLNFWTNTGRGFPSQDPFPVFTKVKLWVEIKKAEPDTIYPMGDDINAPVIYKSPTVADVDADSQAPISFSVSEEIILDIPALTRRFGYKGAIGYAFNLYAQDDTGVYLVSSNLWLGAGTNFFGKIKTNHFRIVSQGLGGGEIEVQGTYELP
jgi:hypothetical protein